MDKSDVRTEYQAYQAIRECLAMEIEQLDLSTASATELRRDYGLPPQCSSA